MSTKDKTREKLLDSMKTTKKVINEQPDTKQEHAKTYATPAAKTRSKTRTSTPADKSEKIPSTRPDLASDPYQSRGRVWPD